MIPSMGHSRTDVVAAALRVLDEQGLEFCSMRRVAAALDVQASALYHHVPDKQTLLALMADSIVRDVVETQRGVRGLDGTGPEELCRELRRAMLAVRDGADVVATASAYRLGASAVEARLAELLRDRFAGPADADFHDRVYVMDPVGGEDRGADTDAGDDADGGTGGVDDGVDVPGDDADLTRATEGARILLHFVFGHTQATQMQLQAQAFTALAAGRPADAAADPPGGSRADLEASFDRGVAVILAGLAVRMEPVTASS